MARYRKALIVLLICNVLAVCGIYIATIALSIPEEVSVTSGAESRFSFSVPASASVYKAESATVCQTVDMRQPFVLKADTENMELRVNLFGVLPFKKVTVHVVDEKQVMAAGIPIGIYVRTKGVMVVDLGEVKDIDQGKICPGEHIIKSGDYILEINGNVVSSRYDVMSVLKHMEGPEMTLLIERDGKTQQVAMQCANTEDGYKLGIWIRDDMQGIGTMTYIDGSQYGALGHSITDQDTGKTVSLTDSTLYRATILSIKKGESGHPGELGGMIRYGKTYAIGTIEKNTNKGIYGTLYEDAKISGELLPIGYRQDVKAGTAYIRSWLSGEQKDYEIRIKKVHLGHADDTKGMEIEVTDPELIALTGGIVQGMSGSPILQDGKLIGAVTHVFVKNPTKGYGIFVESMLEE